MRKRKCSTWNPSGGLPYSPVTLIQDGVTDSNVEEFLDGLDLIIEECDGLQMKFDIRLLAKQRGRTSELGRPRPVGRYVVAIAYIAIGIAAVVAQPG